MKYKIVNEDVEGDDLILDMNEWQCSGITGAQPINEACGGCVGCILAQAIHYDAKIEEL